MDKQTTALSTSERHKKFVVGLRQRAPAIMRACPRGVDGERLLGIVENSVAKNPDLLDCKAGTVFQSVADAMVKSWEIGEHAFLVPFKDTCTLMPSWRGMLDLAFRTGELVAPPKVTMVYEGESFTVRVIDGDESYDHDFQTANPHRVAGDYSRIIFVYCVARLKNGQKVRHYMSCDQINAHKQKYSRAYTKSDSPWVTNWAAMAAKTVILQMLRRGMLPVSVEDRRFVKQEELIERGERIVIDATAWADVEPEQAQQPQQQKEAKTVDNYGLFLDQLMGAIDLPGASKAYDKWFGPDSQATFTDQERADAVKALESKKTQLQGAAHAKA